MEQGGEKKKTHASMETQIIRIASEFRFYLPSGLQRQNAFHFFVQTFIDSK